MQQFLCICSDIWSMCAFPWRRDWAGEKTKRDLRSTEESRKIVLREKSSVVCNRLDLENIARTFKGWIRPQERAVGSFFDCDIFTSNEKSKTKLWQKVADDNMDYIEMSSWKRGESQTPPLPSQGQPGGGGGRKPPPFSLLRGSSIQTPNRRCSTILPLFFGKIAHFFQESISCRV